MYADSNLCAAMRAPKDYHPIIPSKLFFATVSATSETIFLKYYTIVFEASISQFWNFWLYLQKYEALVCFFSLNLVNFIK